MCAAFTFANSFRGKPFIGPNIASVSYVTLAQKVHESQTISVTIWFASL